MKRLWVVIAVACGWSCSSNNNGATGTGGRGGSAGLSGTGLSAGASGTGGATLGSGTVNFTFLNDTEGFAVDTFANAGPFSENNPQNIGGVPNGAAEPMALFDGTAGMPTPGSVQVTATFNDFNQTVTVRLPYQAAQTIDLTGRTITAQVRLDPGSGSFTGVVHLMALSSPSPPKPAPGYYFAQGNSIRLTDNAWHTLTFHMTKPEFAAVGFDPTDIVQIGIQFASGPNTSMGASGGAGGGGNAGGGGGASGGMTAAGGSGAGGFGGIGGSAGGGDDGGAAVADAGAPDDGSATDAASADDAAAPSTGPMTGAGGAAGGSASSAYGAPQSISVHFDSFSSS